MATTETVQGIIGWLGMLAAFFLFLAPVSVFRIVVARKDVQQFSPTVYLISTVQCALWAVYALVTPDRFQPLVTNLVGTSLQAVYVGLFIFYAKKQARTNAIKTLLALLCGFAGLVAIALLFARHMTFLQAFDPEASLETIFLGICCMVLNIIMYAAPLSVAKMVIETKSSKFMPLPITIGTFLCASLWSVYSVLAWDLNIMVPNSLGIVLAFAQLALWIKYRDNNSHNTPPDLTLEFGDMEPTNSKAHHFDVDSESNSHITETGEISQLNGDLHLGSSDLGSASASSLTALL